MITLVTTHKLPVFKLFYEHKLHEGLKENLILYADKEDASDFRALVDPNKTKVFDRSDIIKYYGDLYLPNAPYCKKMYFLNMIFEMGLVDDDFYMTDDDILVCDESFYDIKNQNKIIHDKDTWPKIEGYKKSWPEVYKWYKDNMEGDPLFMMATNFFVPKIYAKEVTDMFTKKFASFIRLLKDQSSYIDKLNSKAICTRNCSFLVFYLEVPFFDDVFSSLNRDYFSKIAIYCVAPSELSKIRDRFNTTDSDQILKKFVSRTAFPKKQPLLHFNFANKEPMMIDVFNYLNNRPLKWNNINDLLHNYPREVKKIVLTKSLF